MEPRRARYEEVPAHDWNAWVDENDAVVIDVRQPEEWELGTLDGSMLIQMGEIPARLAEIPADRAILCVCRSGSRSARVASFLTQSGYSKVANMTGGMKALGLQT
ncbi:MAG: rhodanese-like domain-containing protein [Acidimicrobiia bacterium]|nr:rhodanese-like domain-containing protein [Acidimicrobiia bacterium]